MTYAIANFLPPNVREKVATHRFRRRWMGSHSTRRVDDSGYCPLGYAAKLMGLDCPEVPEGRQFFEAMLDSSWRDGVLEDESITSAQYGVLLDHLWTEAERFARDWDKGLIPDLKQAFSVDEV